MKIQSCSTIWWAATDGAPKRAATAVADRKQAWNAALRSSRSRPRPNCARMSATRGRSEHAFADQRADEQQAHRRLRPDVRPRRALEPQGRERADPVDEQRAHHRREPVAGEHARRSGGAVYCTPRIHPWPASATRMPGAPHTAIRSQPWRPRSPRPRRRAASATQGAASQTTATTSSPTSTAIQVAATPSATAAARFPAPWWRAARRGGAVGEERAQARHLSEHDPAHGETRASGDRCPEVPDDGRVDEQVERLGDQDDQRRRRQREDPPRPRVGVGRSRAHPSRGASASARRTRSRIAGASPSRVNPEATRCPPPPSAEAAAATSMRALGAHARPSTAARRPA